jgi:hypothetical protein
VLVPLILFECPSDDDGNNIVSVVPTGQKSDPLFLKIKSNMHSSRVEGVFTRSSSIRKVFITTYFLISLYGSSFGFSCCFVLVVVVVVVVVHHCRRMRVTQQHQKKSITITMMLCS